MRKVRAQVPQGRPEPVPALLQHRPEHRAPGCHGDAGVRGLPGLALGQPQAVPRPSAAGQGRHRPDAAGDDGAGRQRRGAARLRRAARAGQGGPGRRAGPGGHLEPELVPRGVRAQGPRHPSLLRPRADAEGRQGGPAAGLARAGGGLPAGARPVAAERGSPELVGIRPRRPAEGAAARRRGAAEGWPRLVGGEAHVPGGGRAAHAVLRSRQAGLGGLPRGHGPAASVGFGRPAGTLSKLAAKDAASAHRGYINHRTSD
mmetsp:Transcript_89282/g.252602  ORF Transcript_89282/g.252602 Transcript_89282/m.252602 type:complete len:259 (+) Transcript_89282:1755-2531(+)